MLKDSQEEMNLKIEDTIVVNVDISNIFIISFLEAIYEDEDNYKQAKTGIKKCFALIKEKHIDKPVNIIFDLRPMGNKSHISPNSRDTYIEFISDERIKKVAVIGSSNTQTSIANLILSFNGTLKNKLAWFSEEEEAKFWLHS